MLVAIISTKIPILLGHGFWGFSLKQLPYYGFWGMFHEARTDFAMLLGSIFLLILGGGLWSFDANLSSDRSRALRRWIIRDGVLEWMSWAAIEIHRPTFSSTLRTRPPKALAALPCCCLLRAGCASADRRFLRTWRRSCARPPVWPQSLSSQFRVGATPRHAPHPCLQMMVNDKCHSPLAPFRG